MKHESDLVVCRWHHARSTFWKVVIVALAGCGAPPVTAPASETGHGASGQSSLVEPAVRDHLAEGQRQAEAVAFVEDFSIENVITRAKDRAKSPV